MNWVWDCRLDRLSFVSTSLENEKFPTWPDLLATLISGGDLSRVQAAWAMNEIMSGEASDVQIAGFLVALRSKGETVAELTGLVDSMVANAKPLNIEAQTLDIVGTGGDRQNTVNISTMATLVCAGAGINIVKHGNRASSSSSGSADVLEALGVRLDVPIERLVEVYDKVGIAFCFANVFHPSMRHVAVARRQLRVPTAFNFMGPLTNPALPSSSAIGCSDLAMAPIMAGVLASRGSRGLVFRGNDGLDELTTTAPNRVWEVRDGQVNEFIFDAQNLGIARASIEQLRGGDALHNAEVVKEIVSGAQGPIRDAVVLNAAAGMVAYEPTNEGSFEERMAIAVAKASASIDSGAARSVLATWSQTTQRIVGE
ncbi:anthranilate phosphoribosyltransferase [Glutamicibacter halophytocola]|uniref:Anthranilate phosphoribosyltransferase n=2 Tax=Glutamicibacter halophytocola TaxID=1933880 RepID=A0ABX5Y8C8_9MICC|nr:anthranilate phosphoribosyltransferase [Glutamicibacter sp. FBE19]QDY65276.1 anthranilate phosphoribosyltransferase [Glutamicibacter halophytocola]